MVRKQKAESEAESGAESGAESAKPMVKAEMQFADRLTLKRLADSRKPKAGPKAVAFIFDGKLTANGNHVLLCRNHLPKP